MRKVLLWTVPRKPQTLFSGIDVATAAVTQPLVAEVLSVAVVVNEDDEKTGAGVVDEASEDVDSEVVVASVVLGANVVLDWTVVEVLVSEHPTSSKQLISYHRFGKLAN
jgi:hypothetical protein